MWKPISDLFQRRTLLNRKAARRKLYTTIMNNYKRVKTYISWIRQHATNLKSMDTDVDDQNLATAVLRGPPEAFDHFIAGFHAVATNDSLTLYFVESRLLQKEQWMPERSSSPLNDGSVLLSDGSGQNRFLCTYCKRRGHSEAHCRQTFPHL